MSFSNCRSALMRYLETCIAALTAGLLALAGAGAFAQSETSASTVVEPSVQSGSIRLRQPPAVASVDERPSPTAEIAYLAGEFERFVQRQAGTTVEVRRFGAELISGGFDNRGAETSPLVPTDYVIAPGDEILLTIWGSVDADLRLVVDRGGRISIPRVGPDRKSVV